MAHFARTFGNCGFKKVPVASCKIFTLTDGVIPVRMRSFLNRLQRLPVSKEEALLHMDSLRKSLFNLIYWNAFSHNLVISLDINGHSELNVQSIISYKYFIECNRGYNRASERFITFILRNLKTALNIL